MKIYVKESMLVAPAAATPCLRLWSSNLDLIMYSSRMASIYFYRPNGCAEFFDLAVLKEALSRILMHFYPLVGRKTTAEDGRLEIDCYAKGVLYVAAESDAILDDLDDFAPRKELRHLVPADDNSGRVLEYPLSVVQEFVIGMYMRASYKNSSGNTDLLGFLLELHAF
ncbi:hypothetical protein C2S52_020732 [Perilla frutescens var. hirtella]|nr:hypothetical protein C2S52_020732 [Perilla frutescens var. hirtella]KAH6805140.1 hypothetical protein C2S51_029971 [Perilla frutescens var. frutescens]